LYAFVVITFLAVMVEPSGATTVTIHTEDARATLVAMEDHSLTKEEATKIATMDSNQAVIRRLQEFKIPATVQTFADALYSAAHDQTARGLAEQTPLEELAQQIAAGTLKVQIGRVFQINEIVEAHRLMEENKAGGKIVVLVP
jgi:NADPH:quinone reductase-like Zn-dependent oxidoreductase